MKRAIAGIVAGAALIGMSGCIVAAPAQGSIFTQVSYDGAVGSGTGTSMGMSQCTSILGLVATGDASISAAMANGKITEVSHVDHKAFEVLGIYGVYETDVYGK
ncbi:MAG: TRL-like family protein [Planctomycetota bacterium]